MDRKSQSPPFFAPRGRIKKEKLFTPFTPFSPAGKFQSWIHFESLTDPRDRVFHRTILFGAEIINLALILCESRCLLVYHVKDRVQTILHIKVRLPLVPVPQDTESSRVGHQLLVKVEDM